MQSWHVSDRPDVARYMRVADVLHCARPAAIRAILMILRVLLDAYGVRVAQVGTRVLTLGTLVPPSRRAISRTCRYPWDSSSHTDQFLAIQSQ